MLPVKSVKRKNVRKGNSVHLYHFSVTMYVEKTQDYTRSPQQQVMLKDVSIPNEGVLVSANAISNVILSLPLNYTSHNMTLGNTYKITLTHYITFI